MTARALMLLAALAAAPLPAVAQTSPAADSPGQQAQNHQAPPASPHEHGAPPADQPPGQAPPPVPLPPFIPPLTDADRAAAFPDVHGHRIHDHATNYFVLLDQFEWQSGGGANTLGWDVKGWVGRDRDRLWFRGEGGGLGGSSDETQAHLFYGRAIARWWDLVAGIRQDVTPGPARTWAALGVQGLAPYWFEVEVTGYVGTEGRALLRVETEYELLVTNRLILQPLVEMEIHGRDDPDRGIGAGLSTVDVGARLRYEFRREVAPYVGVVWSRAFFGTRDAALAAGQPAGGVRLALGLRLWM